MTNENLKKLESNELLVKDVGSIITLTSKVPPEFAQAVNDFHKDYNVRLIEMSDLDEGGFRDDMWKRVVVEGLKEDLIKLNEACMDRAYRGLQFGDCIYIS